MSTIRQFAEQVRWRWFLPLIMASVTFTLVCMAMVDYMSWDSPLRHMGWIPNVFAPPELLARGLNGPSLLPGLMVRRLTWEFGPSFLDLSWLPAVTVFWLLIGAILDWKLKHSDRLIKPKNLRIAVLALLILVALLLLGGQISWIWERRMIPFTHYFTDQLRRHGLWAPVLDTYLEAMWSIAGIVYFTRKLWKTFMRRQPNIVL